MTSILNSADYEYLPRALVEQITQAEQAEAAAPLKAAVSRRNFMKVSARPAGVFVALWLGLGNADAQQAPPLAPVALRAVRRAAVAAVLVVARLRR